MLYRPRYAGVLEYGRSKNVRAGGSTKKRVKGENIITVKRDDLIIIDSVLWGKVQKRLAAVKATYVRGTNGNLWGRPETGRESKYLLSGLSRCGCCGANMVVVGGQKHEHYYYACSYRINRGSTVCDNDHRVRMVDVDNAVLDAIRQQALNPDAFNYVVDQAMQIVKARLLKKPDRAPKIEREIGSLRRELDSFMSLIASGNAPDSILTEISMREERIKFLGKELGAYREPYAMDDLKLLRMRKKAMERLEDFNGLISSNVPRARQGLRKLLKDEKGDFAPIIVNPVYRKSTKTFEFNGKTIIGGIFNKIGAEERT